MKAVLTIAILFFSSFAQQSRDTSELRRVLLKVSACLESKDVRSLAALCSDDITEIDIYPDGYRQRILGKKNFIKLHESTSSGAEVDFNIRRITLNGDKATIQGTFTGTNLGGYFEYDFIKKNGQWLILRAINYTFNV